MDIVKLKGEIADRIQVRPYVEEFLRALASINKEIILLTNAHPSSLQLKMKHTGLLPYFDSVVSTHRYGFPKENTNFWPVFISEYAVDVTKTLMVDDTESVLLSAKDAGIRYLWTIAQPDSSITTHADLLFPAVKGFDEVMPSG